MLLIIWMNVIHIVIDQIIIATRDRDFIVQKTFILEHGVCIPGQIRKNDHRKYLRHGCCDTDKIRIRYVKFFTQNFSHFPISHSDPSSHTLQFYKHRLYL